jgi:lipid II:glycine glycyltransferase (peptidoglycan interpeptide bridge formation enzyme)
MEKTESVDLQQQVNDLSQRLQVLEHQVAKVLEAQVESQSHLEFLKKQSELRVKEQEIQAKRARLALPRLP